MATKKRRLRPSAISSNQQQSFNEWFNFVEQDGWTVTPNQNIYDHYCEFMARIPGSRPLTAIVLGSMLTALGIQSTVTHRVKRVRIRCRLLRLLPLPAREPVAPLSELVEPSNT